MYEVTGSWERLDNFAESAFFCFLGAKSVFIIVRGAGSALILFLGAGSPYLDLVSLVAVVLNVPFARLFDRLRFPKLSQKRSHRQHATVWGGTRRNK